ncbi:MAG: fibronectin type III domain-containing protein, partial [Candidatus Marinimicrobia bacterium]|nr:fibronectin type III domain-containing protein [Candidatus Neomarinimicrobiota bacterium]
VIDSSTGVPSPAVMINNFSFARFVDCIIRNSTNTYANIDDPIDGGAFHVGNSELILDRCQVLNNSASAENGNATGAGIFLSWNTINRLTLINTIVADNNNYSNSQSHGGGLAVMGGQATIINSTIANNSESQTWDDGAGIFVSDGAKLTVFNSIIFGNTPANEQIYFTASADHAISYSILDNMDPDYFGEGNLNVDPEFASYSLHDRSPAIGAGAFGGLDVNGDNITAPAVDIDGNPRPTSGDNGPDMGAYENALLASPYPSPPTNVVANPLHRTVDLSWTASDSLDVLKYFVYQSEDSTNWTPVDTVIGRNSTTTTIANLTNGNEYWFGVSAIDNEPYESVKTVSSGVTPEYTGPAWYVDDVLTNGEGSPESPFNDISSAWNGNNTFGNGDTVLVLPGTYDSFNDLNLMAPGFQFVIKSRDGAGSTTIDGGGYKRFISFENFNY